eukprot:SAG31_NODE_260_length_18915_cov_3.432823_8_plen_298_part_00
MSRSFPRQELGPCASEVVAVNSRVGIRTWAAACLAAAQRIIFLWRGLSQRPSTEWNGRSEGGANSSSSQRARLIERSASRSEASKLPLQLLVSQLCLILRRVHRCNCGVLRSIRLCHRSCALPRQMPFTCRRVSTASREGIRWTAESVSGSGRVSLKLGQSATNRTSLDGTVVVHLAMPTRIVCGFDRHTSASTLSVMSLCSWGVVDVCFIAFITHSIVCLRTSHSSLARTGTVVVATLLQSRALQTTSLVVTHSVHGQIEELCAPPGLQVPPVPRSTVCVQSIGCLLALTLCSAQL